MNVCSTDATSSGSPCNAANDHAAARASGTLSSSKGCAPSSRISSSRAWICGSTGIAFSSRRGCANGSARDALGDRPETVDDLGRLVDRGGGGKHRGPHREPVEVVVGGPQLAAALAERGDVAAE